MHAQLHTQPSAGGTENRRENPRKRENKENVGGVRKDCLNKAQEGLSASEKPRTKRTEMQERKKQIEGPEGEKIID